MKIREGAYYRRRDGAVVGPAQPCKHQLYPWMAGGETYTPDGRVCDDPTAGDLVNEVQPFDVPSTEQGIVDALRANRGTQPSRQGQYLCYTRNTPESALFPHVLSFVERRWFDGYQEFKSEVVTWCGPLPRVEQGS